MLLLIGLLKASVFLFFKRSALCSGCNPFTYKDGWQLVFCGSRQLTAAEGNYAPVEGEALAIAWCLQKAKIFLLGCPKFTIFMDHKPLLRIFSDKMLEQIENPRLFHMKEKTLQFNFDIQLVAGKNNLAADALSRYPVDVPDSEDEDFANEVETTDVMLAVIIWRWLLIHYN